MTIDVLERNNVKLLGAGSQTIVFAHGFGCDQDMWRYIVPGFSENYQIVLFDYVGSGQSQINYYDAHKYSDLRGYATDVLEIMEALKLRDAIFIGSSLGILSAA